MGKCKGHVGGLWGKKWRREAELPQTCKLAKFLVLESQVGRNEVVKCEGGRRLAVQVYSSPVDGMLLSKPV